MHLAQIINAIYLAALCLPSMHLTGVCFQAQWPGTARSVKLRMPRLDNDPFLNELTKLYERNKKSGSVWITMKRSNLKPTPIPQAPPKPGAKKGAKKPFQRPPAKEAEPYQCLVRATDGKRNISTGVLAADHAKFQASFALVLRAHMDALKRRVKPKKAAEAAASSKREPTKAS